MDFYFAFFIRNIFNIHEDTVYIKRKVNERRPPVGHACNELPLE